MDCCSKAIFCSKSDGGLLQNNLVILEHTYIYIYIWHKRPFVPLPAKSFNSALEEQLALITFERVIICPSLAPIGRCQVLVYIYIYMCECICMPGEEKMPTRPCPVRSGPSGLSGPGALGPGHWSGPDGPDRTGQGQARLGQRAVPALSGPVRSGWGRAARASSPPLYN